jgi:hypothetical protein
MHHYSLLKLNPLFFTEETTCDYKRYKGLIEEASEPMLKLDDTIHDFLNDEKYIETAKRVIQKAGRGRELFKFTAPTT